MLTMESPGIKAMLETGAVPPEISIQDLIDATYDIRPQRLRQITRNATQRLINNGTLKKDDVCERCGSGGKIETHHVDYSDPLNIKWLCSLCHDERHAPVIVNMSVGYKSESL
jgi:hypothetical protein